MAPPDPQIQGEKLLVTYIMSRVRASAESLRRNTADRKPDPRATTATIVLTPAEQPVFNRYTYYGWTYGLPAALTVFGLTFGGLRFAAYRRWIRAQSLPNSSTYHARTSASRQQYEALDKRSSQIKAASSPVSSTLTATPKNETFHWFADEVAVQVQFMVTVALSLLVGTVTSNFTYNISQFHRDLAQVPLQPGVSKLCHEMCPQLLQQREKLLSMSSLQQVYDDHLSHQAAQFSKPKVNDTVVESSPDSTSNFGNVAPATIPPALFDQATLQLDPRTLWHKPRTEDLECMSILVENCRLRLEYEAECRRRQADNVDASGMVHVPKSGVPIRYHKSSAER